MKNLDLLKDKKIDNSLKLKGGIGVVDVFIWGVEKAFDYWLAHPEVGGGVNRDMKLGHMGGGRP
jgi:hypothetical protein